MGLFASRPEEPSEWAGIPSEPAETASPVEHLEAPLTADIVGLLAPDPAQSILIPIARQVEVSQDAAQPGDAPKTDKEH